METIIVNHSNLNAETIYNLFNNLGTSDKLNFIDKVFKRSDFLNLINGLKKKREMTLNDAIRWFNTAEPPNGLTEEEVISIVKEVRHERYATA